MTWFMALLRKLFFKGGWPVLMLPVLLAACQTPGASPPARLPAVAVHPGAGSLPSTTTVPEPPSPSATPSVAELIADPARFKGLSATEVTALLGTPNFLRREADAEIWQYYGPASACVLDLFLYPEQDERKIAHAELRSRGNGPSGACLAQIVNRRAG